MALATCSSFWSSVDLTGNQTLEKMGEFDGAFWSSVDLTGNQTSNITSSKRYLFWSSVDLTGNQTYRIMVACGGRFGAVSI